MSPWCGGKRTRARRRRRPGARGDARHRAAHRGLRAVVRGRRRPCTRGVPDDEARSRAPRPDAARHRRSRRLPADPLRERHAHRHAHRAQRHHRRRPRAGVRRRRLHRQALQAQGAHRPHAGTPSTQRCAERRDADDRRRRDRCCGSRGVPQRRADRADPPGVRPAGGARPQARSRVHPRAASRAGLGLPPRRRHPAGQRPRATAPREGRARPRAAGARRDREGGRLQGRPAMIPELRSFASWIVHHWRGSLQIRVAATTLVLSAIVSALLGVVLLQQIRNGLVEGKTRAAIAQLNFGLQHAADQFAAVARPDPVTVGNTARTVVSDLGPRGNDVSSYGVVLVPTDPGEDAFNAPSADKVAAIPASLRRTVTAQGREAWTYSRVADESGHPTPALAVGGPVPTATASYQLYYLFPLAQEEQTLALVQRTMLFAGAALVLLLVAIAAIVTRQVVGPVRQAAATAERLAAGRLRDRMAVRGEDDLASLATSFNRMAETVETQISQLRELSRVQRRFVADVSHELRTPITTIRMAADVLHDSRIDLPPELARSSELLQMQLDRFEGLLADLLEISRFDAGAAALEPEAVALRGLVAHVVELAEPIAEHRESRIELDLPREPVVVDVDTRRIERVLRNLVVNAVEHGAGRPVQVRLASGPGGVAVTVRDHGAGLRPGEAALVFGRFWRGGPGRARAAGGRGPRGAVGLRGARLHGGWLQAWGEPGLGCVFRLTLPWHVGGEISASPLALDPTEVEDPAANGVLPDGVVPNISVEATTEPADV